MAYEPTLSDIHTLRRDAVAHLHRQTSPNLFPTPDAKTLQLTVDQIAVLDAEREELSAAYRARLRAR